MKKLTALILSLVMVLSLFTGCSGTAAPAETNAPAAEAPAANESPAAPAAPKEIVIGLVGPSTGEAAYVGEEMKLLVDVINAQLAEEGGVNGIPVRIAFEDDAGASANASVAVQKLIDVEHANAIVGPMFTSCVLAAKPIVNEAQVPTMIATSADQGIFQEKGYVFSLDCANDVSVRLSTQYLYKEMGFRKIAVLGNYNDQTVSMMEFIGQFWPEYGGEIVYSETFLSGSEDFRTQLTEIKQSGADCLWVRADKEDFLSMVKQIVELGMDDLFICTDYQAVSPEMFEAVGSVLDGRFIYTRNGVANDEATLQKYDALCARFQEMHGVNPESHIVLLYDCICIILEAMKESGAYSGQALRDAIQANTDFIGASGYPVFDDFGKSAGSSTLVNYANGVSTTLTYTIND